MSPRRYVARNHPAMPKAPQRGIRMSMDFPDVESMLEFRDRINKDPDMAYHMEGFKVKQSKLHVYKLDYFDIEEMPLGNNYILSPKTDNKMQELTREIVEVQETKYKQKKKK